jgi:leader peptidase (prepilin peptidase)/N-methyltransferase
MTAAHHLIVAGLSVVVGLCVGSFLNVCIHRLPLGLSLLRPRSRCPRCLNAIRARDNIPVLSWCLLRARCRECTATISSRYVVVELIVGFLFAGSYLALAAFPVAELWDVIGPLGVLGVTLILWMLISLMVVCGVILNDGGWPSARSAVGRCVSGQDEPLSGSKGSVGGDAVAV